MTSLNWCNTATNCTVEMPIIFTVASTKCSFFMGGVGADMGGEGAREGVGAVGVGAVGVGVVGVGVVGVGAGVGVGVGVGTGVGAGVGAGVGEFLASWMA